MRCLLEVELCQAQQLTFIDVVDVDSHVSQQFRRDIWAVFLNVGDPVMRRIGLATAMTEDEDRARSSKRLGDLAPILRTVVS